MWWVRVCKSKFDLNDRKLPSWTFFNEASLIIANLINNWISAATCRHKRIVHIPEMGVWPKVSIPLSGPRPEDTVFDRTFISTLQITTLSTDVRIGSCTLFLNAATILFTYLLICRHCFFQNHEYWFEYRLSVQYAQVLHLGHPHEFY